ncbi:zinc-ribbon domain-containing protein [Micromonospora echinofusca]|nr:zinc-ribbon domain-containing protein [Micromonospora echinofusca]
MTLRLVDLPEVVVAWRDEQPIEDLTLRDRGMWKLECPNGHKPRMSAYLYYTQGCQHCRAQKAEPLTRAFPELAAQWHPTKNRLTPDQVGETSRRRAWWISPCCAHEWEESPRDRVLQPALRCPLCNTILRSLAYRDPDLAAQWHPGNALTAYHVKPFSSVTVRWVCPADASHQWDAPVMVRSSGTGCPTCSTAGKSAIETALAEALKTLIPATRQDARIARTGGGPAWRVDVLTVVAERPLAVEYDGEYWHRDKTALDLEKTADLLTSGHLVVRVRENDLPDLPIEHPHLLQTRHRPQFETAPPLAASIVTWARSTVAR